ncbi:MAG: DNA alkylation repair protein [Bacteroidia bacterium]|nr:DNA alkylation repair protein [Bacteroidia bacterium]
MFSLKDHLFNKFKVEKIATEIGNVYPEFARQKFVKEVLQAFPNLELKERIYHITDSLQKHLPSNFEEAVSLLVQALPAPCNPALNDNDFGDFIYASFAHFVAMHGCSNQYLAISFKALEQITMRFSAEDAIRYFINQFPEQSLAQMQKWTKHKHYHVRRLASEGLRPKLPWCQKIYVPIEASLPVLHLLHSDSTRFVTRSVANHLNDISKTDPSLVIAVLHDWKSKAIQKESELQFIIKHALRTLIKNGHPEALQLLGVGSKPPIKLLSFGLNQRLKFDDYLGFKFEILAEEDCNLMIDYVLYFKGKNGESSRKKVFKLKQLSMSKGQKLEIQKSQQLKQNMSTRTLYPGAQGFELQINGEVVVKDTFFID